MNRTRALFGRSSDQSLKLGTIPLQLRKTLGNLSQNGWLRTLTCAPPQYRSEIREVNLPDHGSSTYQDFFWGGEIQGGYRIIDIKYILTEILAISKFMLVERFHILVTPDFIFCYILPRPPLWGHYSLFSSAPKTFTFLRSKIERNLPNSIYTIPMLTLHHHPQKKSLQASHFQRLFLFILHLCLVWFTIP